MEKYIYIYIYPSNKKSFLSQRFYEVLLLQRAEAVVVAGGCRQALCHGEWGLDYSDHSFIFGEALNHSVQAS